MILFKVNFINNVAVGAVCTLPKKPVEWKENPYSIISIEVYANNNTHAVEVAQARADVLLKDNR